MSNNKYLENEIINIIKINNIIYTDIAKMIYLSMQTSLCLFNISNYNTMNNNIFSSCKKINKRNSKSIDLYEELLSKLK